MKINYTLEATDFLEHQLFTATNSDVIRKQRRKTRFAIPTLYVIFGLAMSAYKKDLVPLVIFGAMAVVWFFTYPLRERKRYEKHYLSHVNETYKNRIGTPNELTLEESSLTLETAGSQSRFMMTEIEEIDELQTILMIKLRNGGSFLIPKLRIENIEMVRQALKEAALKMDFPFNAYEDWKWK